MGENGAAGRSDKTILVVDDTGENLTVIGGLLQPFFRVRVANSGMRALKVARSDPRPDLILLDVMMPEMDGYAVLAELRQDPYTRDIPVMFVTAMDGDQDEEYGLSLGAVDYITKPIRPAILLARVRTHLELKDARDWLRDQNGYLEGEVSRRMRENDLIKDVSLNALALLAEKRDNETGNHLYRTQAYVEALMQQLQDHPRFRHALSAAQRQLIAKAAPLHDIGKVGIPDQILLKPARLTPEEFEIMKTHSLIGAEAIEAAIERVVGGDRARLDELQGNRPWTFSWWPATSPWAITRSGTAPATPRVCGAMPSPSRPASWPWPTSSTPSPASATTRRPFPWSRPWPCWWKGGAPISIRMWSMPSWPSRTALPTSPSATRTAPHDAPFIPFRPGCPAAPAALPGGCARALGPGPGRTPAGLCREAGHPGAVAATARGRLRHLPCAMASPTAPGPTGCRPWTSTTVPPSGP